jgi:hypothetical protein
MKSGKGLLYKTVGYKLQEKSMEYFFFSFLSFLKTSVTRCIIKVQGYTNFISNPVLYPIYFSEGPPCSSD